jgi:polar amino acid transport system substrate-binding protein
MHRLLTAIAVAAVGMGHSAQAGETLDRVMQNKTLVMSTDADYPPQSSLNAQNEFEGFDIDVGREIAERMGVEIEFVTPGWDVVTAGNWGGRWDISVGSMAPTEARAEVLDFPAVYYYTPAALAVHESNTEIQTPADASGKAIGVGAATSYENYLKRDIEIEGTPPFDYVIDDPDTHAYDIETLALDDLRLGDGLRLDAAIAALPTILAAQKAGYPIRVVGDPLFLEPLAIATDKGDPEFAARIAGIVQEMREDGTLRQFSEKWYGADLTAPEP